MLALDDLKQIADQFSDHLEKKVQEFDIGGHPFSFNSQTHFMGVVNLSPDSWYRESVCLRSELAIRRAKRLHIEGAHLIDLGAESSILEASSVSESSQLERLIPVIQALSQEGLLVSVETYHPHVALKCLDAGAKILNLTGTTRTEEIFRMVAERNAAVILCYVQGDNVRQVDRFQLHDDMIPVMKEYFAPKLEQAIKCGVQRIFIDPGLGFYYKNLKDSRLRIRHQMRTFLHTFRLHELGWPTCHALPHAFEYFEDQVRSGEPFFNVLALLGKTKLLRTHEIPKIRAVTEVLGLWQKVC
jgi:dihydropteroate synthase